MTWGQRGRLGEQQINERARAVAQAMNLSNLAAVETHLSALPSATAFRVGETWAQNLNQAPPGPNGNAAPNAGIRKTTQDYFFERVWIR